MSDLARDILNRIDPKVTLDALQGYLGTKTSESVIANEKVAKAFEKAGINCGPQGCRSGFVQRQLMIYAGENMVRELHQKTAQKENIT